jgi:hypothetical protein
MAAITISRYFKWQKKESSEIFLGNLEVEWKTK